MSEALLHWLVDINAVSDDEVGKYKGSRSASTVAAFLQESGSTVETMLAFIDEHYDDRVTLQPLLAQILLALQRGGPLRVFALQFVPTVMHALLYAATQPTERAKCIHLEAFLLAIYNHEIVDDPDAQPPTESPDSLLTRPIKHSVAQHNTKPATSRRVETYRIPNMCQPSIYHDPVKLSQSILVDNALLSRVTPPSNTAAAHAFRASMLTTVAVGPYTLYTRINNENRYIILSRLVRSLHAHLAQVHQASVLTSICDMVTCLCRNGYTLPVNDLAAKVLQRVDSHQPGGHPSSTPKTSIENRRGSLRSSARALTLVDNMDDVFSTKPRMPVHPGLLLELTHCVYYAIFNGYADVALVALAAVHQRATLEAFPNVLLMSNAIINSLLENPSGGPTETSDPMGVRIVTMTYDKTPRRQLITNASLRMRRMPEDIPVIGVDDKVDGSGGRQRELRGELAQAFRKKLVQLRPDSLHKHLHHGHRAATEEDREEKETPPHHPFAKLSLAQKRAKSRLLGLRSKITDSAPIMEMNEATSNSGGQSPSPTKEERAASNTNGDAQYNGDTATITNAMVDDLAEGETTNNHLSHISDFSPRMLNTADGEEEEGRRVDDVHVIMTDLSRLKHMDSSGDNISDA